MVCLLGVKERDSFDNREAVMTHMIIEKHVDSLCMMMGVKC